MSTQQQHAEDFGITEKIGEINEAAYEEMTPVLLSEDITGIHKIRRPHKANDTVPTKPRMVPVTKIMLPANCRGGMDGNVHADFCPNMSFCGRCLDSNKIDPSDLVEEMAPGTVLDIPAYVEKLPAAKRGDMYLSILPKDIRKNTRFLPKREAEQFAAAYAACM